MRRSLRILATLTCAAFAIAIVPAAHAAPAGNVLYVDELAAGGNGTSWSDAFNYLQDALAEAAPGDQVWVAAGTYQPDQGDGKTAGDQAETFGLASGVAIYGGFAGWESSLAQRDWHANPAVLSGTLGPGAASYHVVTSQSTDATAILDGFTVTGGLATGSSGAGLYNNGGSPTIRNCTFTGNLADGDGGAIYSSGGGPTVSDCTFTGNSAIEGGAIFSLGASLTVTRCTFAGNSADSGGAMLTNGGSATVHNCAFTGNSAQHGGGLFNFNCSPQIVNCVFTGNSGTTPWGSGSGGAILSQSGNPVITHCSLSANTADMGGGMAFWGSGSPTLANCILWGNTDAYGVQVVSATTLSVNFTDVQGEKSGIKLFGGTLLWAPTSINLDPAFVGGNNLRLTAGSPCIDTGDNGSVPAGIGTDLDGALRKTDGDGDGTATVDMGAYESPPAPPTAIPVVEFSSPAQSFSEGVGSATVTVLLSLASTQDIIVPCDITGTATSVEDFTVTPNPSVTIPAGSLFADITITVNDDSICEGDETVIITMGTPINADSGATLVHTATIIENDSQPPAEAIEELISDLDLPDDTPKGTENSLVSKLEAALKSLDKDNTKAAINQLGAFINYVTALEKAGTITGAQADYLRQAVDKIIADLS